jgi:AcrR family transcriptional regulator
VVDSRPERDDERELMEAMLVAVGELGYPEASVQGAVDRAGLTRARFYRCFRNKADCFSRAYEKEADRLSDEILSACQPGAAWPSGMRAGLAVLLRLAGENPVRARALLIEGPHAGEGTAAKYDEVVKRLSHAVDSARHGLETQHLPPPLTARFIVATVESTICEWLLGDRASDAMSLLPGLVHFSVLYFFGEETARRALEASSGSRPD